MDKEKMLYILEYINDTGKIDRDISEFIQTISIIGNFFSDSKMILNMNPKDIASFLISLKHFSEEIKPLIIKYQILPYMRPDD